MCPDARYVCSYVHTQSRFRPFEETGTSIDFPDASAELGFLGRCQKNWGGVLVPAKYVGSCQSWQIPRDNDLVAKQDADSMVQRL